jgi:hypothetical protein
VAFVREKRRRILERPAWLRLINRSHTRDDARDNEITLNGRKVSGRRKPGESLAEEERRKDRQGEGGGERGRAPSFARYRRVQHTIFSGPLARYKGCLLLLTSIQWKSSLPSARLGDPAVGQEGGGAGGGVGGREFVRNRKDIGRRIHAGTTIAPSGPADEDARQWRATTFPYRTFGDSVGPDIHRVSSISISMRDCFDHSRLDRGSRYRASAIITKLMWRERPFRFPGPSRGRRRSSIAVLANWEEREGRGNMGKISQYFGFVTSRIVDFLPSFEMAGCGVVFPFSSRLRVSGTRARTPISLRHPVCRALPFYFRFSVLLGFHPRG